MTDITPEAVCVERERGNYGLSGAGVASAMILTPFSIAGDLIMLPVMPFVGPFMWARGTKI